MLALGMHSMKLQLLRALSPRPSTWVYPGTPLSSHDPRPRFWTSQGLDVNTWLRLCSVVYLSVPLLYNIAWDRLSNQFLFVCVCMYDIMYVCICGHAYGRIFQPVFTKFGKNLWGLNRKNWLGWGRNPKMPSPILTHKTPKIYRRDRQFPAKYKMQNNLWIQTVKPIIKDAEPNKCVLDAVKSRDPGACQGSHDLLFKLWDPP